MRLSSLRTAMSCENGEANVSAAVPYYRFDGASSLAAFEPLERSEGSSGDAAAAQGASSFQDADLYNDLFVNSRDDRATRPSEDDPALHKAREQLDRNKRAQQRYRLRQKEKLEDYKRQLDELNQKVEQLLEEKVSLENRTQLLEKVVRMKDERLEYAQQQDVEGAKPYDSSELRRTIYEVQSLVHNGDPGFTLEDLRTIQPAQVEEMHKQTVAFLSLLLTKADAGIAGSETNILVTRIINGVRAIKNMGAKMQYSHMRKQELSWKHMRVPPADHPAWSKAVASAGLTAEQKRLLLASHSRLLSKMDAIMRERTAIVTAMTSALPQKESPSSSIDDCESSSDSFLQLSQASDALKSSLAKEHRAMLQFYEETQTEHSPLTALQEARILVEIFPHRFEMLWLCSVLGMEGKQRGADPMPHHERGPPAAGSSLPSTNTMASGPPMHLPGAPSPPATTFVAPRPPSHSGDLPTAVSAGLPPTSFMARGVPVHVPGPPMAGPPGLPPTSLTASGPLVQLPGSPSLPPLFLTAPGGAQESQEAYGSPLSGAYSQAHN
ncbi:g4234 [Coccomyxa elongata]